MCSFLLPYLNLAEATALLRSCFTRLQPKGMLYVSLMFGDHSHSGWQTSASGNSLNIHYYGHKELSVMLKDFDILKETILPSPPNAGVKTTDMVLVARRRISDGL